MAVVTVVDHGAGNVASVVRALRHVGASVEVTGDPAQARRAERLVVPGQGAFGDCMRRLCASGLDAVIRAHIRQGRPYLGICLGLQILVEEGLEAGRHAGLGILRGRTEPMPRTPGLKLPHMGWNRITGEALGPQFDGEWFYFVHSFRVVLAEAVPHTVTVHGEPFVSALRRGALWAVQFHPEKSQQAGLRLLEGFVRCPSP